MMNPKSRFRAAFLPAALLVLAPVRAVPAQMEKREGVFYDTAAFKAAAPAVGTAAPDLVLADLDGRPWALSSFKGKTVVLVKGGYT